MSPPRTAGELRKAFTAFWVERGHTAAVAANLVPADPTVMFTIAGMVPFKDYFTGREVPPYSRATTVQPCLRTVDIDLIGTTARHLTFFEMLGHFSFGDYFKAEAIPWCWEFYTEVLGIDADQLWVTVHESDDEAEKIWAESVGFPQQRIQRMGEDNFWKMGETGPCGPCSELYVDLGEDLGEGGGPAAGSDSRYMEIGNLVFMQYERKSPGADLVALPAPSVDFGGGLERVLAVLQGARSVFGTDVLAPIVSMVEELTGTRPGTGDDRVEERLRVIADHARAIAFAACERVVPSNEGRGFVLRRIIRRVVMKAAQLGYDEALMVPLISRVAQVMGDAYPQLEAASATAAEVVSREEEAFRRTLATGMALLEDYLDETRGGLLAGAVAFVLHDTHGFPIELTREVAAERGIAVDMEGFEREMASQRARARSATMSRMSTTTEVSHRELLDLRGTTTFSGYEELSTESEVLAVQVPSAPPVRTSTGDPVPEGEIVEIFLSRTPFYAESGGQVGDTGVIATPGGSARVIDTTFALPGLIRHIAVVEEGEILPGEVARSEVDQERRDELRRNHTGTHLLHWALRDVLGDHVHQQGSLVAPDRLRFDFSHHRQVANEEIARVEELVNSSVLSDVAVQTVETSREEALRMGAMAIFGEKYGERVRVVEAGQSVEFCGGTHVGALGMIGPLKVLSEASVGAGIRRVEAVTGEVSIAYMRRLQDRLERASASLKVTPEELPEAIERMIAQARSADEELKKLRAEKRAEVVRTLAETAVDGIVITRRDGIAPDEMRELATGVRSQPGVKVVVIAGSPDGKRVGLVSAVEKGSTFAASDLVADAARVVGGGTGRSQEVAVAGGKDAAKIDEALAMARSKAAELLGV